MRKRSKSKEEELKKEKWRKRRIEGREWVREKEKKGGIYIEIFDWEREREKIEKEKKKGTGKERGLRKRRKGGKAERNFKSEIQTFLWWQGCVHGIYILYTIYIIVYILYTVYRQQFCIGKCVFTGICNPNRNISPAAF